MKSWLEENDMKLYLTHTRIIKIIRTKFTNI